MLILDYFPLISIITQGSPLVIFFGRKIGPPKLACWEVSGQNILFRDRKSCFFYGFSIFLTEIVLVWVMPIRPNESIWGQMTVLWQIWQFPTKKSQTRLFAPPNRIFQNFVRNNPRKKYFLKSENFPVSFLSADL